MDHNLKLLLDHSIDRPGVLAAVLAEPDFDATLALQIEAHYGKAAVAKLLVKQPGIDLNATTYRGMSSLLKGCWMTHTDFNLVLIEARANPNLQDPDGHTALMAVLRAPKGQIWAKVDDKTFDALLAVGADVNILNNKGESALTIAEERGFDYYAAKLRAAGAKVPA